MSVDMSRLAGRPTIVFSNSLAADKTMWEGVAAALSDSFGILRFDARGHGETESTPGDYSLELLARDVIGLLDTIGLDRVHFVGLSLGGMIGQWLAVNAPERLKTLTLCATFCTTDPALWDRRVATVRAEGVQSVVDATLQRWLTAPFRAAHADRIAAIREMILATTVDGYAGSAAAIRDMDIGAYPAKIRVPTLLLAAEDDVSATPEAMREIHRRIVGSEFVQISDAAHVFTFEKPELTARVIGDFLTRHEGLGRTDEVMGIVP